MVSAKDRVLERLFRSFQDNHLLGLGSIIAILSGGVIIRQSVVGESADFIYIPILIVMSKMLLERLNILKIVLEKIGRQSTNMWLIHSFFCYYF